MRARREVAAREAERMLRCCCLCYAACHMLSARDADARCLHILLAVGCYHAIRYL